MRTTRSSDQIDPGGKKIDLFPPREFLRTFVFDDCDQIQARIFELTLDALLEIANSNRKRVRERELPVWSGRMSNRMDMKLFIVGLPYELHFPVFQTFEKRFSEDPSFAEISYSPGEEFDAAPFVRYEFGNLIWYGDPFSKAEEVTSPSRTGVKFEIRSWKPVPTRRKIYSATNKPELPERKSPRFHSQEVWEENREAILNFVYGLKGPCSYRTLASVVKKHFGIDVYSEDSPQFAQYGLIRLSGNWISQDHQNPAVRILIRAELDSRLKYIVLAHELAHYALHCPLLLMSRMVEETSWELPEIEDVFWEALTHDPAFANSIETEADDLAAYFLIPPRWHPLSSMGAMMLEGGESPTAEELTWRFLQPYFPEDGFAKPLWRDLRAMKDRAQRDSIRVSTSAFENFSSLFERMLQAALRIDAEREQRGSQAGINKAIQYVEERMAGTPGMATDEAREYLRKTLTKPADLGEKKTGIFIADGQSFCREVIPPLEWEHQTRYPRIPLRPASYNLDGDPDRDWHLAIDTASPVGTVAEWREKKKDHGIVLYRLESWQKKRLRRSGL